VPWQARQRSPACVRAEAGDARRGSFV
jgi:hypothetical protein